MKQNAWSTIAVALVTAACSAAGSGTGGSGASAGAGNQAGVGGFGNTGGKNTGGFGNTGTGAVGNSGGAPGGTGGFGAQGGGPDGGFGGVAGTPAGGAAGIGGAPPGGGGAPPGGGGAPPGGGGAPPGGGGAPPGGGGAPPGGGGAPPGGGGAPPGGGGTSGANGIDLRADVNRDGNVDTAGTSDESGEDTWDATHGAIFLANIDDDQAKCPKGTSVSDSSLAACNDAANTTVDGADDLLDLARLKTVPWPSAPGGSSATVTVTPAAAASKVHVFKNVGGNFTLISNGASLSTSEIQSGVELAIEGTDVRRDTTWDGYLNVTVAMTAGGSGSDTVKMRMSPLMLSHHNQDAVQEYVTSISSTSSQNFRSGMQTACNAAGTTYTELPTTITDQWTQDFFETGYMSMPGAGGQQKLIRVYIRSANYTGTLRVAGRVVYEYFRGKDKAGLTQYDPNHPNVADSLNSYGNTETVPPYSYAGKSWPLGRIIRGSVSTFYPDQSFEKMLTAQGMQTQIFIDTSWLLVGHVDETLSFAKVSSPRGWVLVANDANLAKTMLQQYQTQGYGNTAMFTGQYWSDGSSAQRTISQVLADSAVMGPSAEAVTEVNNELAIIKSETGITDAEIVKIPYLHWKDSGYSVAYQPGTANYAYVGPTTIAAPDPHGPVIGGVDVFKQHMQNAFASYGISVKWVEDWNLYHRLLGEVHCGSNTDRQVNVKWWESGK